MQRAENIKGGKVRAKSKLTRNTKGTGSSPQRKTSRLPVESNRTKVHSGLQQCANTDTYGYTGPLDITGINLESKTGYEILKSHDVDVFFNKSQKIEAFMLNECCKHMPGYVQKQFHTVTEAVNYVFKESARVIGDKRHGLIASGQTYHTEYNDIPATFCLQIVHDTFGADRGIWQSYGEAKDIPDADLKKAVFMCIYIVTQDFGFTIHDQERDYGNYTMDFENWYTWEMENLQSALQSEYDDFKKKNKRKFNPDRDMDCPGIDDINSYLVDIDRTEAIYEDYLKIIKPLQEQILLSIPDIDFIKTMIDQYKLEDVSKWMQHILDLKEKKFCLFGLIGDSYRFNNIEQALDDESMSPISAYGYIYDNDESNPYFNTINQMYNDEAGNSCIIPFCINTVYTPDGLEYETPFVDLYAALNGIFGFNFYNMSYAS